MSRGHPNVLRLVAAQTPYAAAAIGRASRQGRSIGSLSASTAAKTAYDAGMKWYHWTNQKVLLNEISLLVKEASAVASALAAGDRPYRQGRFVARKLGWRVVPSPDEPGFQDVVKRFGRYVATIPLEDLGGFDEGSRGLLVQDTQGFPAPAYYISAFDGEPLTITGNVRSPYVEKMLRRDLMLYGWPASRAALQGRAWASAVPLRRIGPQSRAANAAADAAAAAAAAAASAPLPALVYNVFRAPANRYVPRGLTRKRKRGV